MVFKYVSDNFKLQKVVAFHSVVCSQFIKYQYLGNVKVVLLSTNSPHLFYLSLSLSIGNPIRSLFPPLKYAFIVPTVFGVIFLGGIALFSFYHIWSFTKAKQSN